MSLSPQGMACPPGWEELPTAQGRLLVAVTDGTTVGITVSSAMADQVEPAHSHNFDTTLHLPVKNIAAISCCNGQGACQGMANIMEFSVS
jgi:hypothetical protein